VNLLEIRTILIGVAVSYVICALVISSICYKSSAFKSERMLSLIRA